MDAAQPVACECERPVGLQAVGEREAREHGERRPAACLTEGFEEKPLHRRIGLGAEGVDKGNRRGRVGALAERERGVGADGRTGVAEEDQQGRHRCGVLDRANRERGTGAHGEVVAAERGPHRSRVAPRLALDDGLEVGAFEEAVAGAVVGSAAGEDGLYRAQEGAARQQKA